MKTMSNCSNGVAAASIPMLLTSLPSTNDYRNLSSERSARPLHDAYHGPAKKVAHELKDVLRTIESMPEKVTSSGSPEKRSSWSSQRMLFPRSSSRAASRHPSGNALCFG